MNRKEKSKDNVIKFPVNVVNDDYEIFGDNEFEGFTKEDESYMMLEKINEATSLEDVIKYLNKAIEIYPENIDAKMYLIELKNNPLEKIRELKKIIEVEKQKLIKLGYFEKENIGDFWLIFETRTYMKLMSMYVLNLIKIRKYEFAIDECEYLLKLCKNDNLGIRYILIGLYTFKNDFIKAEKLYKKYKDNSVLMTLPLSFVAYENEDYAKTKEYILKASKENKNLIPYLRGKKTIEETKVISILAKNEDVYEMGSLEEIIMLLGDLSYIFNDRMDYFNWLEENI